MEAFCDNIAQLAKLFRWVLSLSGAISKLSANTVSTRFSPILTIRLVEIINYRVNTLFGVEFDAGDESGVKLRIKSVILFMSHFNDVYSIPRRSASLDKRFFNFHPDSLILPVKNRIV